MKELIEASRLRYVSEALYTVTGQAHPDVIVRLQGGYSSSHMFRLRIQNHEYVLRVMGLDQSLEDRINQIICAQYASRLDISPHYHYANPESGIIVMDYIESKPFNRSILLSQMPKLLKTMHHREVVPKPHIALAPYLQDLKQDVLNYQPPKAIQNYFDQIAMIQKRLAQNIELASCHNDLNLNNILYDGHQLFLVDFEAAGQEDCYFDLATICQQACFNENETQLFLAAYFGQDLSASMMAKFHDMKQISYYYYALHFLQLAYQAQIKECAQPIPSLAAWHEMKQTGRISLETPEDFLLYAWVLVTQSLNEIV